MTKVKIIILIFLAFVGFCIPSFGLFLAVTAFLCYIFPKMGCIILNPLKVMFYLPIDIYYYFRHKKYNNCPVGEIVDFMGMFGKGKTLSDVHMIAKSYYRYNDKKVYCRRRKKYVTQKVMILSNVNLLLPYVELKDLNQIVKISEVNRKYDDDNNTLTVTLVLMDEASVQMNSRQFKTNIDPLTLNAILTCRHNYLSIYYTAQRHGQVDALLRQVTSYVIDCVKTWRLQGIYYYDAWEMENATSPLALKPYKKRAWFVTNKDYEMYDTLACVENLARTALSGDMISDAEILAKQSNNPDNTQLLNPSRKWKRTQKKMYK